MLTLSAAQCWVFIRVIREIRVATLFLNHIAKIRNLEGATHGSSRFLPFSPRFSQIKFMARLNGRRFGILGGD